MRSLPTDRLEALLVAVARHEDDLEAVGGRVLRIEFGEITASKERIIHALNPSADGQESNPVQ